MSGIVILILRIILAASLYAFLAWALIVIWRELRAQGLMMTTPQIPTLLLTPLEGDIGIEDDGHPAFDSPEVVIGRSTACELAISNDTVSSRHARLSYHHNQWWLEDLNSTNGTYLNDERVSMPTVVVTGDELRVGQVNMVIGIQDKPSQQY
jgi:hypothetical protein